MGLQVSLLTREKNWVCVYSLFALKGIIPAKHHNMWAELFMHCQILCSKIITTEECREADDLLMSFCKQLCGKENCTPNMHLHGHLLECVQDYGPVYSFWCFSFERYNGILGDYHTNNVNVGKLNCTILYYSFFIKQHLSIPFYDFWVCNWAIIIMSIYNNIYMAALIHCIRTYILGDLMSPFWWK